MWKNYIQFLLTSGDGTKVTKFYNDFSSKERITYNLNPSFELGDLM